MVLKLGRDLVNLASWLKRFFNRGLAIRRWRTKLIFNIGWLLLIPASLWAVATVYVPVMGSGINSLQAWGVALAILVLAFLSLLVHVVIHIIVARLSGIELPEKIVLIPTGDPSQCWSAVPHISKEVLVAIAAPVVNGILAGLFYLLWNWQINIFINVIASFLIFFNLVLMALNLIPAFPFDGGRLLRVVIWWLLGQTKPATRLASRIGWGLSLGLIGWGIFLVVQQVRYSLITAAAAFGLAAMITGSFFLQNEWKTDVHDTTIERGVLSKIWRSSLAVLILLPQCLITASLFPLNNGFDAPGFTASIEPMVRIPIEYSYSSAGKFILTSVISQSPIVSGVWFYAHFDHSIKITPPEEINPDAQTIQETHLADYRMLLNSEQIAVIVGLRLAGHNTDIQADGVMITSILSTSQAVNILQLDDIITGINGYPVRTSEDLIEQLDLLTAGVTVQLTIERSAQILELDVPTMLPEQIDDKARIGIFIEQHTSEYTLPFPVEIVVQKVLGGPSAGLMFTLGVYDALNEEDLTKGRIIAGTGTIDLDGNVGPIGGVQQKIVAAERAGAEYFFSPEENYPDALAAATRIIVIEVNTVENAIDFLRSLLP